MENKTRLKFTLLKKNPEEVLGETQNEIPAETFLKICFMLAELASDEIHMKVKKERISRGTLEGIPGETN